jgi:hypothetical protein
MVVRSTTGNLLYVIIALFKKNLGWYAELLLEINFKIFTGKNWRKIDL